MFLSFVRGKAWLISPGQHHPYSTGYTVKYAIPPTTLPLVPHTSQLLGTNTRYMKDSTDKIQPDSALS